MFHRPPRHVFRWLAAVALLLLTGAPAQAHAQQSTDGERARRERTVGLQLLTINDFHGALETRTVAGRPAGGAAVLSAYLDNAEAAARAQGMRSMRVAAGDLIGASPPISALFRDEPTIHALDMLRFSYSSVGNHEFDKGVAELRRLQNGGCDADRNCFEGAQRLQYLAANVVDERTGKPILPPYAVEEVRSVKVGFIGVVLEQTPRIVTPAGVAGLRFLDEAETINKYVAELKKRGIEAIVVLIHQGGSGSVNGGPLSGDIVPIVQQLDREVDVVVSGHTHQGYQSTLDGILVTSSFSNGTAYGDIQLTLDHQTGDVTSKSASIVTTFADVAPGTTPDPRVARFVARTAERVAPLVNRVIGTAATALTRTRTAAGESALGNLIADAQRNAMNTQVGFTNSGGIREDIAAGPVTFGELFTVQPFANDTVSMTLTGAQIERLLEQQWSGPAGPGTSILQVSGIRYTWNPAGPVGDRVQPEDVFIGGQPLNPTATYSVTVNSYLATGGDGFSVFTEGTNRVVGPVDLDALITYIQQLPQPFTAAVEGRIQTR